MQLLLKRLWIGDHSQISFLKASLFSAVLLLMVLQTDLFIIDGR